VRLPYCDEEVLELGGAFPYGLFDSLSILYGRATLLMKVKEEEAIVKGLSKKRGKSSKRVVESKIPKFASKAQEKDKC